MADNNALFEQAGAALAASNPASAKAIALTNEAKSLMENIEGLNGQVSEATARLNKIRTKELPDVMSELSSSDWTNAAGDRRVKLKDFVSGTLPKEAELRAAAIQWLDDNGGSGLMRTVITLVFGRSEHAKALALAAKLKLDGFDPLVESGVHPQTLQAFARERIKKGESVDAEKLGLFIGRVAEITFPEPKNVAPKM